MDSVLEWMEKIDKVLEYWEIDLELETRFVVDKFRGKAKYWWNTLQNQRAYKGLE